MSDSVLSQQEINALLRGSSSPPSLDEDLLDVFQPLNFSLQGRVQPIVGQVVTVEGPYIEGLEGNLGKIYYHDLLLFPAVLEGVSFFLLVSKEDSQTLSHHLRQSPESASRALFAHWLAGLAPKGAVLSLRDARSLAVNQFGSMPITEETYVIRSGLSFGSVHVELGLMVFASQGKSLVQRAREKSQVLRSKGPATPSFSAKRSIPKGEPVTIRSLDFTPLQKSSGSLVMQEIQLLEDVVLPITVELGTTTLTLEALMELKEGSVISLNKLAGELADVYINGHSVAKAEITVLEENFGVRIVEIVPPTHRVKSS